MKITIIISDKSVYKDKVSFSDLDFSDCNIPNDVTCLQWDGASGWVEYASSFVDNEAINELPAWAQNCIQKWSDADYAMKNPPPPTAEQLAIQNEQNAKALLSESDWSQLSDVNLSNKAEWVAYRAALRAIAINPSANVTWPAKPTSIWVV